MSAKSNDAAQILANELLKAGIDAKVWLAGDEVHISCHDEDENEIYAVLEQGCGGSSERGTLYGCDVCLIRYGWESGTEQIEPEPEVMALVLLIEQLKEMIDDGVIDADSDVEDVYEAYTTAYHHELNDEDFNKVTMPSEIRLTCMIVLKKRSHA